MGVNLKNFDDGEIQPQCSSCGVCLCWGISTYEYLEWSEFWDEWECKDCNPDYKNAYDKYKQNNEQFKILKL